MRFADVRRTYIKGEEIPIPDKAKPDTLATPRILADTPKNRAQVKG